MKAECHVRALFTRNGSDGSPFSAVSRTNVSQQSMSSSRRMPRACCSLSFIRDMPKSFLPSIGAVSTKALRKGHATGAGQSSPGCKSRAKRGSEALGMDAIYESPYRGGAGCAALSGLMDLLAGNPCLRMLRILRPGLFCRAPSVLIAPTIGTMPP